MGSLPDSLDLGAAALPRAAALTRARPPTGTSLLRRPSADAFHRPVQSTMKRRGLAGDEEEVFLMDIDEPERAASALPTSAPSTERPLKLSHTASPRLKGFAPAIPSRAASASSWSSARATHIPELPARASARQRSNRTLALLWPWRTRRRILQRRALRRPRASLRCGLSRPAMPCHGRPPSVWGRPPPARARAPAPSFPA
jgi:hypothetical protein